MKENVKFCLIKYSCLSGLWQRVHTLICETASLCSSEDRNVWKYLWMWEEFFELTRHPLRALNLVCCFWNLEQYVFCLFFYTMYKLKSYERYASPGLVSARRRPLRPANEKLTSN